jgi:hypothetical protein
VVNRGDRLTVKRGHTRAGGEAEAARELADQAAQDDAVLVLVFASPDYDSDRLAAELARAFEPSPVIGCTTAGEIGPGGFADGSAVAMSLASPELRVGIGLACDLHDSAFRSGGRATRDALAELDLAETELDRERHVAVSLIDGRSRHEELFVAGAATALPGVSLVGGSASDRLADPPRARVFYRGEAWSGCGLIALFDSDLPFVALKSEHMEPRESRFVVTRVEPGDRLVHELNGRPARLVYQQILGLSDGEIDDAVAGRHPFAMYVGGQPYVRSVMGMEGDSLRFACAVDEGAVLRPMTPGDMIQVTEDDLAAAEARVGGISALVAFNCLGRFLESEALGITDRLGEVLIQYPVIGFNTFGEQYNSLHVNHTFTGLVFGRGEGRGGPAGDDG